LAIALLKYDDLPQLFHELLAESYKRLTDHNGPVFETGEHWEEIGFQRSNPATDIRGGGALGPLCLLNLTEQYPQTMQHIFNVSNETEKDFPLACKLFEISTFCYSRVKGEPDENGMNILFNQHSNVYNTFASLVASCFFKLMFDYIKRPGGIMFLSELFNQMKKEMMSKGANLWAQAWWNLRDDILVKRLTGEKVKFNEITSIVKPRDSEAA
jgi:hypothetical protein